MTLFQKVIFTGFAPNLCMEDVRGALGFLLLPWRWPRLRRGACVGAAETDLQRFFGVRAAITFDSGRSALVAALKAIGAGEGDEVLVQAYTCTVVASAIKRAGAIPVFTDIKDHFFMDPSDAEGRITPRTKAMIIQHTFGKSADLDGLLALAKRHNLRVIEDCAHTFGGTFRGKPLGTFGDIGMLSFGSDKAISCVRGGAAITNDHVCADALRAYQKTLAPPPRAMVIQHLLHSPIFFMGKRWYGIGLGKALLRVARLLRLTPRILTEKEKCGMWDTRYPATLPNALACLLRAHIADADACNRHRRILASFYRNTLTNPAFTHPAADDDAVYVRYPLLSDNPGAVRAYAKRRGILLGYWYDAPVAPRCSKHCDPAVYAQGSCPHAESSARGSVNLPTDRSVSQTDAECIVLCLNAFTPLPQ